MNINEKIRNNELMEAILELKNVDEAKIFFRDLLTESELIEAGNRFKAAKMLSKNISYTKIEKETNLSSATVARVSKWLQKGKGGYKVIIDRVNKNHHHHNNSSSF